MLPSTSWYELVRDDQILQGDFIDRCPIIAPTKNAAIPADEAETEDQMKRLDPNRLLYRGRLDIVVISQSCELATNKVENVLVCPRHPIEKIRERFDANEKKHLQYLEQIRRGSDFGKYMLNQCTVPGHERSFGYVDFRRTYSLPLGYVRNIAERRSSRIRLSTPFREDLAQSFARYFMRVALPADSEIPPFLKRQD